MSVRTRLIVGFMIATLAPLAITVAISIWVLQFSLSIASTKDLDELSKSLEKTGRELYRRTRESLQHDAAAGTIAPQRFDALNRAQWPADVVDFAEAAQPERVILAGNKGDRMDFLVRHDRQIWVYSTPLHDVALGRVAEQYARARGTVDWASGRNLRRV